MIALAKINVLDRCRLGSKRGFILYYRRSRAQKLKQGKKILYRLCLSRK